MFARVSTFQGSPDQTAEGIRVAREQILPVARLQDGFKGIFILFDSESGRSLSVTLWASGAGMVAREGAAFGARSDRAEAGGGGVGGVQRDPVGVHEAYS